MVRKSLLVLFLKTPSAICNQRFDTAYLSICFVIIGGGRFRAEFRRQQGFNPESQDTKKKLYYGAKRIEFIIRGGRHQLSPPLVKYTKPGTGDGFFTLSRV